MATLTAKQIAGLVKTNIGGNGPASANVLKNPDTDGPLFVAICLAESGGVTDKVSPPNADQWHSHDKGLWQINDHWHADLMRSYKWDVPTDNLAMAAQLYSARGGKFTDWSTYKNGKYAIYMTPATTAWGGELDTSAADPTAASQNASSENPLTIIGNFLDVLTKQTTWIRVGEGVGGALILIIVAISIFKREAMSLSPVGAIAKQVIGSVPRKAA